MVRAWNCDGVSPNPSKIFKARLISIILSRKKKSANVIPTQLPSQNVTGFPQTPRKFGVYIRCTNVTGCSLHPVVCSGDGFFFLWLASTCFPKKALTGFSFPEWGWRGFPSLHGYDGFFPIAWLWRVFPPLHGYDGFFTRCIGMTSFPHWWVSQGCPSNS